MKREEELRKEYARIREEFDERSNVPEAVWGFLIGLMTGLMVSAAILH